MKFSRKSMTWGGEGEDKEPTSEESRSDISSSTTAPGRSTRAGPKVGQLFNVFNMNRYFHNRINYQYQSSKLIGLISYSMTRTLSKSVDCKKISRPNIYSKYWQYTASSLLWWGGRNWIIEKRTSRSLRVLSQYFWPLVMKDFLRNRIHFEFIEAYQIYFCFKLS